MKQKEITQKLTLLYFQYREFLLPILVIVVCVIVFFLVIIPQIQAYFTLQSQFADDQARLQVLQQNFQKVTGLNDQQLNANFTLTTTALPEEKNAIVILNAISKSASLSNVSLKDYNFEVVAPLNKTDGKVVLPVTLSVTGDKTSIQKFIHQLAVSLPLSEVRSIDIQNNTTALIAVVFSMQTFTQSSISTNTPLQLLTDQDRNTLNQLSTWQ